MSNISSPSTRWRYTRVRVSTAQSRPSVTSPEGRPPALSPWPRREPLTLRIHYRGGGEAWFEIKARGRTWRKPGSLALYDVMRDVWGMGL